ncbi:MAG: hypothetical protein HFG90_01940 [Acholeplasmatales bacterium]|jgi:membrane-associated PAP2 superfamily phosphatase|nr:hypothetical protein [Acholeplasmatales bacterium]
MRLLKFIALFLVMIIALIVNIIEGIIMAISYPLRGIDYVGHKVFTKVSEWTLEAAKRFNFLNIFRKYEE